jgi:hypothetical protein
MCAQQRMPQDLLSARGRIHLVSEYFIDISQYRLLFGFFLLYIRTVFCLNCLIAQPSYVKGELRWRGANSISKFDHHNKHKWRRCR